MLKIALCDDEKQVLREVSRALEKVEILHETDLYMSGESLLSSGKTYDLIFLDVDMRGMSGLEAARLLRKRDKQVKIVYLTAYEDYRDYAFSVHAFGYLVKPVTREALCRVVREAVEYRKEEEPPCPVRFVTEGGILETDVRDICYFEYLDRRIRMKTKAGDVWMKGSISEMGERMKQYHFRMPHKSFVVNLAHVKNLKGYTVFLTDGSEVPLSQKKSTEFREALGAYLADQI